MSEFNVQLSQLLNSKYDSLFPKTKSNLILINNSEITSFLRNGSTAEDIFLYLSNFGKHWWKKEITLANWAEKRQNVTSRIDATTLSYPYTVRYTKSGYKNPTATSNILASSSISINNNGKIVLNNPYYLSYYPIGYSDDTDYINWYWDNQTLPCYIYLNNILYYTEHSGGFDLSGRASGPTLYINWNRNMIYCQTITSYIKSYSNQVSFLFAQNQNEYPNYGQTDATGAKYWYLGQPFDWFSSLPKIETGYYSGTGTDSLSLTFSFCPQYIIIQEEPNSRYYQLRIWTKDSSYLQKYTLYSGGLGRNYSIVTLTNNVFTLSSNILNTIGVSYHYIAITQ